METVEIESWTKLPANNFVSGHCIILKNQVIAHLNFNTILLQLLAALVSTTVYIYMNYFTNSFFLSDLITKHNGK